jgi:hypothetical protein
VTADLVSLLPKVSALAKRRVKHDHRTQTETAERSISSIPVHISCRLEWDAPCALALCWRARTLQQCCEHSACRSPCSISTAAQRSRISVLRMIMHGLHLQARSELPKHAQRTAGVLVFCCAACALARVARRRTVEPMGPHRLVTSQDQETARERVLAIFAVKTPWKACHFATSSPRSRPEALRTTEHMFSSCGSAARTRQSDFAQSVHVGSAADLAGRFCCCAFRAVFFFTGNLYAHCELTCWMRFHVLSDSPADLLSLTLALFGVCAS